ncbi:DUF3006 family protein [Candidatus Parcubacteria bacterium]|nr:DUF3006 family protein [Candidatus Parcubacteria bacterium]
MIINLTIDRIEDSNVVLKTDDNKSIIWPKNKLPDSVSDGTVLTFSIGLNENEEGDKRQLAKDILNEILSPDNSKV